MDKESLQELLQKDLNVATKVHSCLKSEGWKIYEKILDRKEKELFIVFLDKPEKELTIERKGLEFLRETVDEFKDLINTAVKSKLDLENLAGEVQPR